MRTLQRLLPLVLAALLAGLAQSDGHRISGSSGAVSGQQVALGELARHALDQLGSEVHFTLQLESQPQTWNPYVTRFGTDDYRAAIVWGDEQPLWEADAYAEPAALVFARRGTAQERLLADAGRYARFEATGSVRQVLLGKPWIELTALVPLAQQFSTGSMIHASRAVELMAAEHWELAAQSFERALASDLPERVHVELARLRDACLIKVPQPVVPAAQKKRAPSAPGARSGSPRKG